MLPHLPLESLLGRPLKRPHLPVIQEFFRDKSVLVTGAGGSIGSEICAQLAGHGVRRLVMLDSCEFNLYSVDLKVREAAPAGVEVESIMASAASKRAVAQVFKRHRPDCVLHAAAYKHVPLVEANPLEGLLNNLRATRFVAEAALDYGTRHFLLVSSDKAVNPTSVMGASKRCCELLVGALQSRFQGQCQFCSVRFGNVLGSSGSVLPRFLDQIARGGPVTVTHPDVTRYFMLIPEAVGLVLEAVTMTRGGETFILDMGEPIRIRELAERIITLCGHTPHKTISIEYVGLRPGEKLYEELILLGDERRTRHDHIFVASGEGRDPFKTFYLVDALTKAARGGSIERCGRLLSELVPQFSGLIGAGCAGASRDTPGCLPVLQKTSVLVPHSESIH
jgi:FlaA1/EpsC-like NDP-sugar epimerase